MIPPAICGTCDCNAIAILCFLFGLIGGLLVNVIAEEGKRRKALKESDGGEPDADDL